MSGGGDPGGASRPCLLVVAGEASGDLHAANLLRELGRLAPEISVRGVGGDRMERAGAELLFHYRSLAVVGITEVLAHLGDVRRAMRALEQVAKRPEVVGVVLVDYADFNMQLARRLRRSCPDLPIVYYISPQVWAWRRGRIGAIGRLADRVLVILPFEEEMYRAQQVPAEYVGHPLLDALPPPGSREAFAARHGVDAGREWIALLPGSRAMEVSGLLQPMLGAATLLAQGRPRTFLVARASALDAAAYASVSAARDEGLDVHLIEDDTYELLRHSRGAVVCSGTATLEAGLMGTPEVVVYRTSWLTYNLGKLLVRIGNIALVNVIGGERGVPELLQRDVTPQAIARELEPLLQEGTRRRECQQFLARVRQKLGEPGASAVAAAAVLDTVRPRLAAGTDAAAGAAR